MNELKLVQILFDKALQKYAVFFSVKGQPRPVHYTTDNLLSKDELWCRDHANRLETKNFIEWTAKR